MRDSYQNLRLHTFVVNNIKNGNISKRPASISKQKTSFDNGENAEKFPVAPTSSIPGPILLCCTSCIQYPFFRDMVFCDGISGDRSCLLHNAEETGERRIQNR